jgi:predicted 3-demethylubiquinone-9 3-methyltransferase (glyoxalase superfamily)
MTTVTPFLWYDADLAEPLAYYASVFPSMEVIERTEGPEGTVFSAVIELFGQRLMLLNGGPAHVGFKESFSLMVLVSTQSEIDDLWSSLTADGGEESRCGWLKDRYGLSWQIVPDRLGDLIGGGDPRRAKQALDAMLGMDKLSIDELEAATIAE